MIFINMDMVYLIYLLMNIWVVSTFGFLRNSYMNFVIQDFMGACIFISPESISMSEIAGSLVILWETIWGSTRLFSTVAGPFHTSPGSEGSILHILSTLSGICPFHYGLVALKWYLKILSCISLIANLFWAYFHVSLFHLYIFFQKSSIQILSCTGGYIVIFTYGLTIYLVEFTLSIILPLLFYSFIHMCIHCLGHSSPCPPPTPFPPTPSLPGRTCSALFSNFVEE
jgi:hypothetical protein